MPSPKLPCAQPGGAAYLEEDEDEEQLVDDADAQPEPPVRCEDRDSVREPGPRSGHTVCSGPSESSLAGSLKHDLAQMRARFSLKGFLPFPIPVSNLSLSLASLQQRPEQTDTLPCAH